MKVMVTGGTGFVGCHTVHALLAAGHDVRMLVRSQNRVEPALGPLRVGRSRLEVVIGDITDEASVATAIKGCDAVVHAAALVVTDASRADEAVRANSEGARIVLDHAVEEGCDPIIHVSSSSALWPLTEDPVTPDHPVGSSNEVYPRSKAAADRHARGLQGAGEPVVIVYPAMVMGPFDPHQGEMVQGAKAWLTLGMPYSRGMGMSVIDVRDIGLMIVAAMKPGQGPKRYLAFGQMLEMKKMIALMRSSTDRKIRAFYCPKPMLQAAGYAGELVRRFGRDAPLTTESVEYLYDFRAGDQTNVHDELGIEFRPVTDTFRDQIRWMEEMSII